MCKIRVSEAPESVGRGGLIAYPILRCCAPSGKVEDLKKERRRSSSRYDEKAISADYALRCFGIKLKDGQRDESREP